VAQSLGMMHCVARAFVSTDWYQWIPDTHVAGWWVAEYPQGETVRCTMCRPDRNDPRDTVLAYDVTRDSLGHVISWTNGVSCVNVFFTRNWRVKESHCDGGVIASIAQGVTW
jgi:hypothetical protein